MSWHAPQGSDVLKEVWVVLVTYYPDLDLLNKTLGVVRNQVAGLVVIDNGSGHAICQAIRRGMVPPSPSDSTQTSFSPQSCLIQNDSNLGLAFAQNQGLAYANKLGAKFIWFLDQDSLPQQDTLPLLACAFEDLSSKYRVAAVGPRYRDAQSGHESRFVRFGWLPFQTLSCLAMDDYVEVDFLISSGSLICVKAIEEVGRMDETLFIDHVDTDWCLRARHAQWRLFGVCRSVMSHHLGATGIFLSWPRRRRVALHSPARHYYVFRNSLWLMRRLFAPLSWKVSTALRLGVLAGFYLLFAPDRGERLVQIWRGLRAGLRGF